MIPPVYSLLTGDGTVSGLVGTRIYRHGRAPQDVALPYITWSVVGGHAENYLSERPGIDEERVQIDIWADTAQSCKAVMLAVVSALELHGNQFGMPQDSYEFDTQTFRCMLEFHFWTHR